MERVKVGILGCGDICRMYLPNLKDVYLNLELYACSDVVEEKAKERAEQFEIPHIMSMEEMLGCEEIGIILNLTPPKLHYSLNKAILEAGKHAYCEKPLAETLEQGKELVELAKEKGLYLGCAPDTFMGAGIQTCRKLIDEGAVGKIVGGGAFMMCHGWEGRRRNHPNPAFYYKPGAGPMMDMGPYYITALVSLLGPIAEIEAMNTRGREVRTATTPQRYGEPIEVEVDTHIAGLLRFESGAVVSVITSFEAWQSTLPNIELYGTEGMMIVPDPNHFGINASPYQGDEGVIRSWKRGITIATSDEAGHREWPFVFKSVPFLYEYAEQSRGLGLSDMAACILKGEGKPRASGDLQLHVLEALLALDHGERYHRMETRAERPEAMSRSLIPGTV